MFNAHKLLLVAGVAGVMFAAGIVGAGVMAASSVGGTPAFTTLFAASSPSPTPKSNEATTHESGESAARETAENNGTFHQGGPGGPGGPGGGHPNEDATHESTEPAAREAAENAGIKAAPTAPATN